MAHDIGARDEPGNTDGPFDQARFNGCLQIAFARGTLLVADRDNHLIRKVSFTTNTVSTFCGSTMGRRDGHISQALLSYPLGITFDHNFPQSIYFTEAGWRVRKISPEGHVTTIAKSWAFRGIKLPIFENLEPVNPPETLSIKLITATSQTHGISIE